MTPLAQTTGSARVGQLKSAIHAALRKPMKNQPEPVKAALKSLLLEMRIAKIIKSSVRDFRRLANAKDLKVHLGCGPDRRPGWVNIDLDLRGAPLDNTNLPPETVYVNHDLRRGLPLAEGSCETIYSSHFFEHLEYADGLLLMRDCLRSLKPGGIFRMALPNFKDTFAAYAKGDKAYFCYVEPVPLRAEVERGTETLADYINYCVYQFGEHKCIYDEEKAIAVLREVGFRSVTAVPFCEEIDIGSPERTSYSFYIEAIK